jgi:ubiquinone/menaquinone biosynthesis C-methylase UbiE
MTMSGAMKMRCRGQVEQAATAAPEGQHSNFIRFDDGAAYERIMGAWSRLVGEIFLDWVAPRPGLRWVDVGCGNGAFTELLVERCAPAEVQGVDPSEGQLKYAQARPATRFAEFRQGDAMALPFPARKFDAAVMALVIFFRSRSG